MRLNACAVVRYLGRWPIETPVVSSALLLHTLPASAIILVRTSSIGEKSAAPMAPLTAPAARRPVNPFAPNASRMVGYVPTRNATAVYARIQLATKPGSQRPRSRPSSRTTRTMVHGNVRYTWRRESCMRTLAFSRLLNSVSVIAAPVPAARSSSGSCCWDAATAGIRFINL